MVESFRHGAYDQLFNVFLFDYLLLDDESLFVDVNAISHTGGESGTAPEMLLDYMYREWKSPEIDELTRKEIKDLIDMFEGYLNGKRWHELTEQEQQAGLDANPHLLLQHKREEAINKCMENTAAELPKYESAWYDKLSICKKQAIKNITLQME